MNGSTLTAPLPSTHRTASLPTWRIVAKTIDSEGQIREEPVFKYESRDVAQCFKQARWWCQDRFNQAGDRAFDLTVEVVA